jgi:hypothetical protein
METFCGADGFDGISGSSCGANELKHRQRSSYNNE